MIESALILTDESDNHLGISGYNRSIEIQQYYNNLSRKFDNYSYPLIVTKTVLMYLIYFNFLLSFVIL